MYKLVRNPYSVPHQQSSSAHCCVLFCTVLLTIAGLVTVGFLWTQFLAHRTIVTEAEMTAAFADFATLHGKKYSTPDEAEYRYRIFAENYKKIQEHNADPTQTCTLAVNQFADLTDAEYQRYYLSKPIAQHQPTDKVSPVPDPSIDINWVAKGKVSKVKDQGMCGSCWTFSAISVVESIVAIRENKDPERYSEQQLVDCCRTEQSNGCNGGEDEDAFNYLMTTGIALEKNYPYKAVDDQCKEKSVPIQIKISNFTDIAYGDTKAMEEAIQTRTLSVGVAASHFVFRFYNGGVVTTGCPGDVISHAVTVVGAGTENEIPYWLVRNSWGPNWGDNGYMKIARTSDGTNGVCGISCCAQYVQFNE